MLEPAGYLLATPPYLAALLLIQGRVTARAFVFTVFGLPAVLSLLRGGDAGPLPAGPLSPSCEASSPWTGIAWRGFAVALRPDSLVAMLVSLAWG